MRSILAFPASRLSGPLAGVTVLLCLGACTPATLPAETPPLLLAAGIETDAEGRCFGRDVSPAVIETVTEQVLDRPALRAADGTILQPAAYRTVTRQEIVRERQEVAFETLCPPAYTPEFVETLQRALAARGFYTGPINGLMDRNTGRAVQDFQRRNGPDSPLLSIRTARSLGLVPLSPEEIAAL